MKKCGFIVLALALLVSLCGCSAGEGEASASPTPTPTGLFGIPIEGENITFEIQEDMRTSGVRPPLRIYFLEEDHYIGYAIVLVDWNNESGKVILGESFPKVDGEYQDITKEEVDAAIAAAKEEYQAKKAEERNNS